MVLEAFVEAANETNGVQKTTILPQQSDATMPKLESSPKNRTLNASIAAQQIRASHTISTWELVPENVCTTLEGRMPA